MLVKGFPAHCRMWCRWHFGLDWDDTNVWPRLSLQTRHGITWQFVPSGGGLGFGAKRRVNIIKMTDEIIRNILRWGWGWGLNIKLSFNRYRNSHYKDKTALSLYFWKSHAWNDHLYIETWPWPFQHPISFKVAGSFKSSYHFHIS